MEIRELDRIKRKLKLFKTAFVKDRVLLIEFLFVFRDFIKLENASFNAERIEIALWSRGEGGVRWGESVDCFPALLCFTSAVDAQIIHPCIIAVAIRTGSDVTLDVAMTQSVIHLCTSRRPITNKGWRHGNISTLEKWFRQVWL